MKKDFRLPLMATVLPGLIAACAEPAPAFQSQQPIQECSTFQTPERDNCYEDDDDHGSYVYMGGSKSVVGTKSRVSSATSTSRVTRVSPSVSRGGFATSSRSGGFSGGG